MASCQPVMPWENRCAWASTSASAWLVGCGTRGEQAATRLHRALVQYAARRAVGRRVRSCRRRGRGCRG